MLVKIVAKRVVFATVSLGVWLLCFWFARATTVRFDWQSTELPGYYNALARGFVAGHLYVEPWRPPPELLALPNPWDPAANGQWRLHDGVLFRGKYYLYHGAAPAVLLFAPWLALTGRDLPEPFAMALFAFGAYLFAAGAFRRLADPGPAMLATGLVILGTATPAAFLLNQVRMYELAIGCAWFCSAAGFYFLVRASLSARRHAVWMVAAGVAFGMAVGARPHVGLFAGASALVACLLLRPAPNARWWRNGLAFGTAWGALWLAVFAYNYARFENPLEFGTRYQLAGEVSQQSINLHADHLKPAAWYMLLSPPEYSPVFPWVRLAFRFLYDAPGNPLPSDFFYEPVGGLFWSTPIALFALGCFVGSRSTRVTRSTRILTGAMLAGAMGAGGFVLLTGLTSHRYLTDFAPLLVLAAVVNGTLLIRRWPWIAGPPFAATAAISMVSHLAFGITGFGDDYLRYRPANYVRLASWFSVGEDNIPLLNPEVEIRFGMRFQRLPGVAEPLVTMGYQAHRYFLFARHTEEGVELVSQTPDARNTFVLGAPWNRTVRFEVRHSPEDHVMEVRADGDVVLRHPVTTLVTAPAQVTIGENRADRGTSHVRALGEVTEVQKRVGRS